MSIEPILRELESLGDPKMRKHHLKHGGSGEEDAALHLQAGGQAGGDKK